MQTSGKPVRIAIALAGLLAAVPAALAQDNPNTADCAAGIFEPRPFIRGAIGIVMANGLDDPDNQHLARVQVRCIGGTADVLDFCGEARHTTSSGYIDRSTLFSGRLLATKIGPQVDTFSAGAGTARWCRAVMAR